MNLQPGDVKSIEPVEELDSLDKREREQFLAARKQAVKITAELAEHDPAATWIVSMSGHLPTGDVENEAPAALTVSIAKDQAAIPPPEAG